MTLEGRAHLEAELERLKHQERPKIANQIALARELGDLKENAEYHAAREQQSFVEGRIAEFQAKLSAAQVIDVTQIKADGRVVFGATVHLKHKKASNNRVFRIVGEDEADIDAGKISYSSPIAREMIGKFAGDEVSVMTPNGEYTYKIEKIHYTA